MKEVDYIQFLTNEDKVRIYFAKRRGKISKFIVHYYALIDGRWRSIMRIDTCHGYPHRHTYHLRRKEIMVVLMGNNNQIFTGAQQYIKKSYLKIKDNFLTAK